METIISASEFKARCLQLMDQVEHDGEAIVITKYGRPVAQLGPVRERGGSPIGLHHGEVHMRRGDDLVEPLAIDWEAGGADSGGVTALDARA